MIRIVSLVLVAGVALAGCQTLNRIDSYAATVHQVEMPDDTYRIFEHPKEQALMTTSSHGKTFSAGWVRGATYGLVQPFTPEQRHEAAARKFLDDTGRANCKITRGYLLMQPQYEFFYECPV